MNAIPARLMRAQVEACASRPPLTERQRQRRTFILESARRIFTAHGRARVKLADVAVATGLTQISIRNLVYDMDHLFALTLLKHLDEILAAIGAVPRTHPDLMARRRAEYLRVTRGICNVPTPAHFLWLRDRFTLPDDELEPLEEAMRRIGFMLAGESWQTALLLLDAPHLNETEIEAMLAAQPSALEEAAAAEPQAQAIQPPRLVVPLTLPTAMPLARNGRDHPTPQELGEMCHPPQMPRRSLREVN